MALCLGVFLFELILYGTLCTFGLGWFLSQIREVFSYYLLTGGWRWTLTPWWTRLCLGACQDRTLGPLVFRKPVSWWIWLLPPQLVVWLEAPPHRSLQLVGSWCRRAKVAATRSVHVVECSLLCLPPVSVSPGWAAASHLLPFQETLQDQQVDVAQAPIKLLLLPWIPVHMKFCVYSWKVKLVFPPVFWGLSFWCQIPGLRSLTWGSGLSLLWENLCYIIILQFEDRPAKGYGIWLYLPLQVCPYSPVSLWFLLYVFSCRRSFLVGSSFFHQWLFCRWLWFWCAHERWTQGLSILYHLGRCLGDVQPSHVCSCSLESLQAWSWCEY